MYCLRLTRWLSIALLIPQFAIAATSVDCPSVHICFTPGQPCTQQISNALANAQHSIWVQAYSFTSFKLAKALLAAQQRGVTVKLILDKAWLAKKSGKKFNRAIDYMYKQGMPIWIDYRPRIAHNKVIIIDNKQVITGSFNFTNAAEFRNTENLLIIHSPVIARQYLENWQKRFNVSRALPRYEQADKLKQFKQWLNHWETRH